MSALTHPTRWVLALTAAAGSLFALGVQPALAAAPVLAINAVTVNATTRFTDSAGIDTTCADAITVYAYSAGTTPSEHHLMLLPTDPASGSSPRAALPGGETGGAPTQAFTIRPTDAAQQADLFALGPANLTTSRTFRLARYLIGGVDQVRIRLAWTGSGTSAPYTAWYWLDVNGARAGCAGVAVAGTVGVSNFPATQPVSVAAVVDVDCVDGCDGGGGAGGLSAGDSTRLDYTWTGTWALVGLVLVLIVAPKWFAAFRVTRGA